MSNTLPTALAKPPELGLEPGLVGNAAALVLLIEVDVFSVVAGGGDGAGDAFAVVLASKRQFGHFSR